MTPESLPPRETFSPRWWADFYSWDNRVRLEFVQEALEVTLGVPRSWGDVTWANICEAKDNGSVHQIPGPFDVRHAMVLIAGNDVLSLPKSGQFVLVDLMRDHPELEFGFADLTPEAWEEMYREARHRLEKEFPWIWGWRMHCIAEKEQESRLPPVTGEPGLN